MAKTFFYCTQLIGIADQASLVNLKKKLEGTTLPDLEEAEQARVSTNDPDGLVRKAFHILEKFHQMGVTVGAESLKMPNILVCKMKGPNQIDESQDWTVVLKAVRPGQSSREQDLHNFAILVTEIWGQSEEWPKSSENKKITIPDLHKRLFVEYLRSAPKEIIEKKIELSMSPAFVENRLYRPGRTVCGSCLSMDPATEAAFETSKPMELLQRVLQISGAARSGYEMQVESFRKEWIIRHKLQHGSRLALARGRTRESCAFCFEQCNRNRSFSR